MKVRISLPLAILALMLHAAVATAQGVDGERQPDPLQPRPLQEPALPHSRETAHPAAPRPVVQLSQCKGIDVSHYQGTINWLAVAGDTHSNYAYLKCTEHSSLVDKTFRANLRNCRKAGIPVGAYHFFSPTASPFSQLQNLITALPSLRECDLVPMIDVERRGRCSHSEFISRLRNFLREVERHYGVRPIIYTGQNFYNKYLSGHFDQYIFMIARYAADEVPQMPKNCKFAIWQYSATGSVAGIHGNVDLSRFVNDYTLKDIMIKKQ